MRDTYTETERLQLLQRFLNAETTADEERRLMDFYRHSDALTPDEADALCLMLAAKPQADTTPCEEKAWEFDRLMRRRSALRPLLWTAAVAASVVAVFWVANRRSKGGAAAADVLLDVSNVASAANFAGEQVATFCLRPVGDATVVTKTRPDGSTASYIVCPTDDNEGFHVVPINIEL